MTTITLDRFGLVQCSACRAPVVSPFPDRWTLDLVRQSLPGACVATAIPHKPGCAEPLPVDGVSVRVPGRYVAGLALWPAP